METSPKLEAIDALLAEGNLADALAAIGALVAELPSWPKPDRDAMAYAFAERTDHAHPIVGSRFALAAGALVEAGSDPESLGRRLRAPLVRAMLAGARLPPLLAAYSDDEVEGDDAEHDDEGLEHEAHAGHDCAEHEGAEHEVHAGRDEAEDEGAEHDDVEDDDDELEMGMPIGDRIVSLPVLDRLNDEDPEALVAFDSLDAWYRPAVAVWTRAPQVLASVQKDPEFRAALDALGNSCTCAHWLSILLKVVFDAPFVALFPELDEAWAFTLTGCADMGQLSVLLSAELEDPLDRIGVPRAGDEMLSVMRGDGEQSQDALSYGCPLRIYPWQAVDTSDFHPRDGAFTWLAPGGSGTHSLPADFLPGDIAPLSDGVRVLSLIGPRAPGLSLTRVLNGVRSFEALRARVTNIRRLSAEEYAEYRQTIASSRDA